MSKRVLDLTLPIQTGMRHYPAPWHPEVEVSLLGRHEEVGRQTSRIVLGSHSGTHCDAPRHFLAGGGSVDQLDLELLTGPALMADLSRFGALETVGAGDLAKGLGPAPPPRVMLRFGWSDHWGKDDYYTRHPHLAPEAARWLLEKGVRLLAMDIPNPDAPPRPGGAKPGSDVHRLLLGAGVILVESLCGLSRISGPEVELLVLPLKITGCDGAPARCLAVEY